MSLYCQSSPQRRIKAGQTLSFAGRLTQDGQAVDVTLYQIKAEVHTASGTLVTALLFDVPNQTGEYKGLVTVRADTSKWPLGVLKVDVVLRRNGANAISQTQEITVTKPVTQGIAPTVIPQPAPTYQVPTQPNDPSGLSLVLSDSTADLTLTFNADSIVVAPLASTNQISGDAGNQLKTGSDGGLYVSPPLLASAQW